MTGLRGDAMLVDVSSYDDILEKYFRVTKGLGLTEAGSKEEFFGFGAGDVTGMHFHKQGFGAGPYFRLRDGRVVDTRAQEHPSNPIWYDQTTH